MKTWRRRYEWVQFANCGGSELHTGENLNIGQVNAASKLCSDCRVRPECIEWAIREKVSTVVVAGVYLPDPIFKRELREAYIRLNESIPLEIKNRPGGEM